MQEIGSISFSAKAFLNTCKQFSKYVISCDWRARDNPGNCKNNNKVKLLLAQQTEVNLAHSVGLKCM